LRSKKLTSILLIVSLVFVLFNNTFFLHTHILPDGRVIEHGHPFNSHEDPDHPFHKHESKEFLFLDKILHLFSHSLLTFVSLIFYIGKPFSLHQFILVKRALPLLPQNDLTRAPPLFS